MADKYEDLKDAVGENIDMSDHGVLTGVEWALEWLDEHPDQAPGRTMTERKVRDLRKIAQHSNYAGFAGALSMSDITIVPDPEMTNAERLDRLLLDLELVADAKHRSAIADALDEAGVIAGGKSEC